MGKKKPTRIPRSTVVDIAGGREVAFNEIRKSTAWAGALRFSTLLRIPSMTPLA